MAVSFGSLPGLMKSCQSDRGLPGTFRGRIRDDARSVPCRVLDAVPRPWRAGCLAPRVSWPTLPGGFRRCFVTMPTWTDSSRRPRWPSSGTSGSAASAVSSHRCSGAPRRGVPTSACSTAAAARAPTWPCSADTGRRGGSTSPGPASRSRAARAGRVSPRPASPTHRSTTGRSTSSRRSTCCIAWRNRQSARQPPRCTACSHPAGRPSSTWRPCGSCAATTPCCPRNCAVTIGRGFAPSWSTPASASSA